MARHWLSLLLLGLCFSSCGPNHSVCTGPHADFIVELRLANRPFPADTVVHVIYGGSGSEDYSLQAQNAIHEVEFCHTATLDCGEADASVSSDAAAGSSATDDSGALLICCQLWTGGYAKLEVSGTGLPTNSYDLTPREDECTVTQTIVLGSPDGG